MDTMKTVPHSSAALKIDMFIWQLPYDFNMNKYKNNYFYIIQFLLVLNIIFPGLVFSTSFIKQH